MRKTLRDLVIYLHEIILPETNESLVSKFAFDSISNDQQINNEINAFRAFLYQLFDVLRAKADNYDTYKKVAHIYENRTTLSGYYPFLYNIKSLLLNVGVKGDLIENNKTLLCNYNIFDSRVSTSKTLEVLSFLKVCGLGIEGIDLSDIKQDLSKLDSIKFSYSKGSNMLIGLKIMALTEIKLGSLDNQDIFFRCDYNILKKGGIDVFSIVKDTVRHAPSDVQDFVLRLHKKYLDKGLKCGVEIKGYYTYIKYSYKRKDLWGINLSLNNGLHINVKAGNVQKYTDIIDSFPKVMKEIIAKGYGCGRKRVEIGHCDGGCRGMTIPLDDSVPELGKHIEKWLDTEITKL